MNLEVVHMQSGFSSLTRADLAVIEVMAQISSKWTSDDDEGTVV